jgi:hypothetical protein
MTQDYVYYCYLKCDREWQLFILKLVHLLSSQQVHDWDRSWNGLEGEERCHGDHCGASILWIVQAVHRRVREAAEIVDEKMLTAAASKSGCYSQTLGRTFISTSW